MFLALVSVFIIVKPSVAISARLVLVLPRKGIKVGFNNAAIMITV